MPTRHPRHFFSCNTRQLLPRFFTAFAVAAILFFTVSSAHVSADTSGKTIQLEITTHLGDSQTFFEGDSLAFFVSLDQDAHLLVLYQDASGQLVQIIPNHHMNDRLYAAGLFIRVPDISTQHHFKITAPFGDEKIYAFASNQSLPLPQGNALDNGLTLLTGNAAQVIDQLRHQRQSSNIAWGEAVLEFTTRATGYP